MSTVVKIYKHRRPSGLTINDVGEGEFFVHATNIEQEGMPVYQVLFKNSRTMNIFDLTSKTVITLGKEQRKSSVYRAELSVARFEIEA